MKSIPWGILTHGCTGQVIGGFLLAGRVVGGFLLAGNDQTCGNYGGNGRNLSELIFSIENGTKRKHRYQTKIKFNLPIKKQE